MNRYLEKLAESDTITFKKKPNPKDFVSKDAEDLKTPRPILRHVPTVGQNGVAWVSEKAKKPGK